MATTERVQISGLMEQSGVKFGTSGARGLAVQISDLVAYAYTKAFLSCLAQSGELGSKPTEVGIAGDLRPSTERIMAAVARAIRDLGHTPVNCGKIPSPALAYYGLERQIPTVMVTGSHIPDDRNGIKYAKSTGEITKNDEAGIKRQVVEVPASLFAHGMLRETAALPELCSDASRLYVRRYLDVFPPQCFAGKRIGVYEHTAVGRDLVSEIISGLGAEVISLGRSDVFIPVDTEAIRDEDRALALKWVKEERLDSLVSTDGDSDRPLISDEFGKWLRGDISGILTAAFLGANVVAVPVSCNSAVEKCKRFEVLRTKVGSPYVIEKMEEAKRKGVKVVVGYEANGGFMLGSDIEVYGKLLKALPTRDAVIVHLSILSLACEKNKTVSRLVADELPQRFTASDRLKDFPSEKSAKIMAELSQAAARGDYGPIENLFGQELGPVTLAGSIDGLRLTFDNDEIIHLRPSGNAPEFRCYTEADDEQRAEEILRKSLSVMARWR
jgi:phosphomannomutase